MARKAARFMVVATECTQVSGAMMSRAVLLAPRGFTGPGKPLTESVVAWLAAVEPDIGANA
jgi:hypothetical protein